MSFIENWKSGESAVGQWLATTATGMIVKAGAVPALLWLGSEVANWDIPGWLYVAVAGAVPAAVNAINPADGRIGVGSGGN